MFAARPSPRQIHLVFRERPFAYAPAPRVLNTNSIKARGRVARAHISDPYFMPKAFQSEKILIDPPPSLGSIRDENMKRHCSTEKTHFDDGIVDGDAYFSIFRSVVAK